MHRVFVTRPLPDAGISLLKEAFGPEAVKVSPHDRVIQRDELLEGVKGIEGLLPTLTDRIDGAVMDAAGPQLKVVANFAVGYDNIDVKAATDRGILVANTPGVLTETTADLAWAILMCTARRLGESERCLRAGGWHGWAPQFMLGVDIHGKTLGIAGMGRIGMAMARRAAGFNMHILYTSRTQLEPSIEKKLNAEYVEKDRLLAESDFISVHMPLKPETRHWLGAPEFRAMKKTACLINTARGPVVDEAALAEALKAGEIFAAGLDVFEEEPKVHPALLTCENAVLIPHLGSATQDTRGKMAEMAAQNIIARLRNETPPNPVNPDVLLS